MRWKKRGDEAVGSGRHVTAVAPPRQSVNASSATAEEQGPVL